MIYLGKEQSGGEEGDVDDIELPLGRFVGDSCSGEDVTRHAKKKDLGDGLEDCFSMQAKEWMQRTSKTVTSRTRTIAPLATSRNALFGQLTGHLVGRHVVASPPS